MIYFVLGIPAIAVKAWAYMTLYTWFLLPLGSPLIESYWHMLGAAMFLSFVTHDSSSTLNLILNEENDSERCSNRKVLSLVWAYMFPTTIVLFGYVYHYFMELSQ